MNPLLLASSGGAKKSPQNSEKGDVPARRSPSQHRQRQGREGRDELGGGAEAE